MNTKSTGRDFKIRSLEDFLYLGLKSSPPKITAWQYKEAASKVLNPVLKEASISLPGLRIKHSNSSAFTLVLNYK